MCLQQQGCSVVVWDAVGNCNEHGLLLAPCTLNPGVRWRSWRVSSCLRVTKGPSQGCNPHCPEFRVRWSNLLAMSMVALSHLQ